VWRDAHLSTIIAITMSKNWSAESSWGQSADLAQ
jgi:hypothetical protein